MFKQKVHISSVLCVCNHPWRYTRQFRKSCVCGLSSFLDCADQGGSVASLVSYSLRFDRAALALDTGDKLSNDKPSCSLQFDTGSSSLWGGIRSAPTVFSFSQIALSFPQKPDLRYPHNTSAQNRRNSHSTHFPRCGGGGGSHSSESIRRICLIASRVLRRRVSEIETAVMRRVGIR